MSSLSDQLRERVREWLGPWDGLRYEFHTLRELADVMGVSVPNVSQFLGGKQWLKEESFNRLVKFLGLRLV